jgi:long-chain acyl-CoA synthetase
VDLLVHRFLLQARSRADREALGERGPGGWHWRSWGEVGERARACAAALAVSGLRPGDAVAVLSASRREWVEVEMATMLAGGVLVPIHPATPESATLDIVRRARARFAFADEPQRAERLVRALDPAGTLARVVVFDPLSRLAGADARGRLEIALADLAAGSGGAFVSAAEFVEAGRHEIRRGGAAAVDARTAALRPDDPATVVFNWSAAGRPLATVLTHDNLVAVTATLPAELGVTAEDRTLLFLPLAHVYPRLLVWTAVQVGCAVGFAQPRGEALRASAEIRPDFLIVVPRFLERLRRELAEEIERDAWWRRSATRWALDVARRRHEARAAGASSLLLDLESGAAERLVHRRLRERLGGRLRFIVCGGAPLEPDTARFFTDLGVPILEGYGMTEGTGLTAFNRPGRARLGTVGTALAGVDVRAAPDGELLFRGRNVMRGYLDDPAATAEVLDADGWLHSGDLGTIDREGYLRITGRKKDVIVTEGGKNVSPRHLEDMLRSRPIVGDAVVVGDRRPHLVALLTLAPQEVAKAARVEGIVAPTLDEARNHPAIRALLDEAIADCNGRVDPFQRVRAFAVVEELETPGCTGRARRAAVEQRYREVIDRLYRGS